MSASGGETEWLEVAYAQSEIEAGLIIGKLEEAGIDATSVTSSAAPGAWLTGSQPLWVPANVLVPADRAEEAKRVLSEASEEPGWGDDQSEEPGIVADPEVRSGLYWVTVLVIAAMLLVLLQSQLDLIRL